jgi:hypothetical protein
MFVMYVSFAEFGAPYLQCKLNSCLPFCLIRMVKRGHFINTATTGVCKEAAVWFVGDSNERLFLENVSITI